jgi:hypothetical protein
MVLVLLRLNKIDTIDAEISVSEVELVSNSSAEGDDTSTVGGIIKCFSVYSNVKNLVKTDLPSDSVTIIHGLKFFWDAVGHHGTRRVLPVGLSDQRAHRLSTLRRHLRTDTQQLDLLRRHLFVSQVRFVLSPFLG